jgi:Leucine-rich repeat (LRR) protein
VLSLNNNRIAALSPVLARCTALQVLQLSGNRLTELGLQPLAALRRLRELDAANNCLQSVDGDLFPLLPLQDLDLSANMLLSLPASIGSSMPSLTQLKVPLLLSPYF